MSRKAGFKHSLTTRKKISENNRRRRGIKCNSKKILNTDWKEVEKLILNKLSTRKIAEKINLSRPTILKYIKIKFPSLVKILKESNEKARGDFMRSSGVGNLNKLRREKRECLFCKTTYNLQLHHIKKAEYDNKKRNYINGDHSNKNIIVLCSSCHQKLHYAQGDKKTNKLKNLKTGRFIKKIC